MNRIILVIFFCISTLSLMSQNISDALNYTNNNIDGSARFSAMGGAFGALGGEISSISANPAGSAIFNNSFFSLSFASDKKTNDVSLLNAYNTQDKSNLTILNTDHQDIIYSFDDESITDAYVDIGYTFGYPHQQAFLGYESFIIEPDSFEDDNTSYTSNVVPGTFNQTYYSISRGYNGKFTANVGAEYSEKLYLGANLNVHFVDYDNYNILEESNTNGQSGSLHITDINFENRLSGFGGGFSFQ